jgi:hypothetical protein
MVNALARRFDNFAQLRGFLRAVHAGPLDASGLAQHANALKVANMLRHEGRKLPLEIPVLPHNTPVTFTRDAILSIFAHSFFGSWAERPNFPLINMSTLFADDTRASHAKLDALLAWAERACEGLSEPQLLFYRRRAAAPSWQSITPLVPLRVVDGPIEDSNLALVDFANKYVGGGIIAGGAVQEEILFATAPELIVACLVTPRLERDEALLIYGATLSNKFTGYSSSLAYAGLRADPLPMYDWRFAFALIISQREWLS